ncbi:MAG: hypothetical protein GX208_07050 [Firmicutes bacterium]|nr:hypothetical protein [Bacillota bacterium]
MDELYQESSQVNLLVALLLRFPILSRVHYYPQENQIKMVIFLKEMTEDNFKQLGNKISEHLEGHNQLLYKDHYPVEIHQDNSADLSSIIILHQLNLSFCEEITIILELIKDNLESAIITEGTQFLDDLLVTKDDLEELIIKARNENNKTKLIGLRSDGKVLVYSDQHRNLSS